MRIEHVLHVGHQTAQIGPETGRENDGVECLGRRIGEYDAIRRETIDAAAYPDRAVPDLGERPDIDQRHAPVLLDHLPRTFGGAAQSQLSMLPTASRNTGALMRSTRRAGKRRYRIAHDRIGKPRRSRGRIWTGTADRQRDIDAGIGKVERDLAAGIAEADHQHALAGVGRRIAIFAAMDHAT